MLYSTDPMVVCSSIPAIPAILLAGMLGFFDFCSFLGHISRFLLFYSPLTHGLRLMREWSSNKADLCWQIIVGMGFCESMDDGHYLYQSVGRLMTRDSFFFSFSQKL